MDMGFADQHWLDVAGFTRESDAPLRPVGWTELCARLAAGQDFRAVLAGDAEALGARRVASFHRSAAEMLAGASFGGEVVNLNPSVNGKAAGDITGHAEAAHPGFRRKSTSSAPAGPSLFE